MLVIRKHALAETLRDLVFNLHIDHLLDSAAQLREVASTHSDVGNPYWFDADNLVLNHPFSVDTWVF